MAIDFFVMPYSRYLTGAFITPTMRFAWSQGLPYSLMGQVVRQIPADEPLGGADAHQRRAQILASGMLAGDLAQFPKPIPEGVWDEASTAEPRFHRVDPVSYQALIDESRTATFQRKKGSWLGLINRTSTHRSHLAARVFLPVLFDDPFMTSLIIEGLQAGSVQAALTELGEDRFSAASLSARETLREALTDAAELRFPLFVDA